MYLVFLIIMILGLVMIYINKELQIGLEKIFILSFFLFITFVAGFRYKVGIDYDSYHDWFVYGDTQIEREWLYSYLMNIVRLLEGDFYWLTLLMALLTSLFVYKGLKNKKLKHELIFVALVLFCTNHFLVFFNLMRQGLAVAIFFYCSKYIYTREFKKYAFFIFLASGVHFSAIFLIFLYFVPNIEIKFKKYLILIITTYVLVYLNIAPKILNFIIQFTPYAERYYNHNFIINNNVDYFSPIVLFKVIFSLLLFYLVSKKEIDINMKLFLVFYQMSILFNILTMTSFMFDRVGIYFKIFEIICIPYLISKVPKKDMQIFLTLIIITFTLSVFILLVFINPDANMLRYKHVFFDN